MIKRTKLRKQRRLNLGTPGYQPYFAIPEGVNVRHQAVMREFHRSSCVASTQLTLLTMWGYFDADLDSRSPVYVRTAKQPPHRTWENRPRKPRPVKEKTAEAIEAIQPKPKALKRDEEVVLTMASGLKMIGTKAQIAEQLIDSI